MFKFIGLAARRIASGLAIVISVAIFAAPLANAATPGVDWVAQTTPQPYASWSDVTYGNGVFVAVGSPYAATGNLAMTSQDGVTWTQHVTPANNYWTSITFANGLFVAVATATSGVVGHRVMTSPDGETWTLRTTPIDTSVTPNKEPSWSSVTYGNGLFVSVSSETLAKQVMTSADGITWTLSDSASRKTWGDITFAQGKFVTVGSNNGGFGAMTSSDGTNWTLSNATPVSCWASVTFGNALFVAVACGAPAQTVMTSPDGVTWTPRTAPSGINLQSVTFGDGTFVAVGDEGARVMISSDGTNWTSQTAPSCNWLGTTYGNGLFVAVAYRGVCNASLVMSSGALSVAPATDPATWVVIRQALPLPSSGSCTNLVNQDSHVAYGTGITGGWVGSWEPWVNSALDANGTRIGGLACIRSIVNDGRGWRIQ